MNQEFQGVYREPEVEFPEKTLEENYQLLRGMIRGLDEFQEVFENIIQKFSLTTQNKTILSFFDIKEHLNISEQLQTLGQKLLTSFEESLNKVKALPKEIPGRDFFVFDVPLKENLTVDRMLTLEALSKAMFVKNNGYIKFQKQACPEIQINYYYDINTTEETQKIKEEIQSELCCILGFSGIFCEIKRVGPYVKEMITSEEVFKSKSPHIMVIISWKTEEEKEGKGRGRKKKNV